MLEKEWVFEFLAGLSKELDEVGGRATNLDSRGERQAGESREVKVWCNYCNELQHTKDTCWKLNGKPPKLKNNKFPERNG
ncbi:hypothetical protein CK203_026778 [Vitis vinifera]|uniref:Uncharacterized protein n=1 Tax=Vitis vinifera TaxID=29760 RepID=A0A438IP58_VITVI|nr:hypothetical protein CK203_026778 [Vitis vinifera]